MSNKKVVGFKEKLVDERGIPGRHEFAGVGLVYNPMTGQFQQVAYDVGSERMIMSQRPEERLAAITEAREEGKKTSRERGYKLPGESRQVNKPKKYNAATGKWEGGKTKRRRNKKRRLTRK
jgi:hypothetical protein